MPSLYVARFAGAAACAPRSPRPLSMLEAARQGLAANPIDRSDPPRRHTVNQQPAQAQPASKEPRDAFYDVVYANRTQNMTLAVPPVPVMVPTVALQQMGAALVQQIVAQQTVLPVQQTVFPAQQTVLPAQSVASAHARARAQRIAYDNDPSSYEFNPFAGDEDLPEVYTPARLWPPPMNHNTIAPRPRQPSPRTSIRHNRPARPVITGSMTFERLFSYATMAAAAAAHEPDLQQYHELSSSYMGSLLWQLEDSESNREDMEVEEAAGVVKVTVANVGVYIINKQPPNKQIWLSSPISGPKRFDYRDLNGDGGKWVYGRDGSSLTKILNDELSIGLVAEGEGKKWVAESQKFE